MSWNGEAEAIIRHKEICPLLKKWRHVAKGKETVESVGLREDMVQFLRTAMSTLMPEGGAVVATVTAYVSIGVCVHARMYVCMGA